MWCCPPENPTQDLVEFLKHVRFCGEKQGSVSWVPAGWDAQTRADQAHGHGQPRPGSSTEPSTLGLTPPETNTAPSPKIQFLLKPSGHMGWDLNPEPRAMQDEPHPHFQLQYSSL